MSVPQSPRSCARRASTVSGSASTRSNVAGAQAPEFVHVNKLVAQPEHPRAASTSSMVPGGFAYGDDISVGPRPRATS